MQNTSATYQNNSFGAYLTSKNTVSNPHINYIYGFQNQEKDDEIKGSGNSVNFTYRMHDPRLGRFFAVDPLAMQYPYNSPYAFSENNLIHAGELEGLEKVVKHVYNYETKAFVITEKYIDNSLKENVNQYVYQNPDGQINRQVYKSWTSGREYVAPVGQVDNYSLISTFNGESRGDRGRVNATPSMFDGTFLSPNRADYHKAPFEKVELEISINMQAGPLKIKYGFKVSDTGGEFGGSLSSSAGGKLSYDNNRDNWGKTSVGGFVGFNGYIERADESSPLNLNAGIKGNYGVYQAGYSQSTNGEKKVSIGIGTNSSSGVSLTSETPLGEF